MNSKHQQDPGRSAPGSLCAIARTLTATALFLPHALVFALPDDGNADVIFGSIISVDELPAGVSGGANEINHVPGPENNGRGTTQSLTINFGVSVYDVSATFDNFLAAEAGGCKEVGRWTAFSAAGAEVGTATFEAGGPSPTEVTVEPLQYLVFSAEPYADNCTSSSDNPPDSSDYTVLTVDYATTAGGAIETLDGNNAETALGAESFLAYDPEEPFRNENGGGLLSPDGLALGEILIEPDKCEGGSGDGSGSTCQVAFSRDFSTSFQDAADVSGTLKIGGAGTITDPRPICGGSGSENGALQLTQYPSTDGGFLTIPPHLCGIPNGDGVGAGVPQFVVLDIDSDLTVTSSIIFHRAQDPLNTAYACKEPENVVSDLDRSTQPVLGWLPRAGEIPVRDANGNAVTEVEDLTLGGCGSYRGGTGRMSYLVYGLHHVENADYEAIVAGDIAQLRATVEQWESCVSRWTRRFNESFLLGAERNYQRGRYDSVKREFEDYRDYLTGNGRLAGELARCYYNGSAQPEIQFSRSGGSGLEPRNFRGDLLAQVNHIIYMLETMLGAE